MEGAGLALLVSATASSFCAGELPAALKRFAHRFTNYTREDWYFMQNLNWIDDCWTLVTSDQNIWKSKRKIFFYCYPSLGPPEKEPYQHLLVCLGGPQATGDEVLLRYKLLARVDWKKINISFVIIQKITPILFYCYITTFVGFLTMTFFQKEFISSKPVTVYLGSRKETNHTLSIPEFRLVRFYI